MDNFDLFLNNVNLLSKHVNELKSLLATQKQERERLKQNFSNDIHMLLINNGHMMDLISLHSLQHSQLIKRQTIEIQNASDH